MRKIYLYHNIKDEKSQFYALLANEKCYIFVLAPARQNLLPNVKIMWRKYMEELMEETSDHKLGCPLQPFLEVEFPAVILFAAFTEKCLISSYSSRVKRRNTYKSIIQSYLPRKTRPNNVMLSVKG